MTTQVLNASPRILTLYPRALLNGFLPKRSRDLPNATVKLPSVKVDKKHLQEYCDVCGFTNDGTLPATYPHMLAFPLHMALMTRQDFPYPLLGLVHVSNSITQHRPIKAEEILAVECSFGQTQPHDKGTVFSLISRAYSGQELVWESESAMLFRSKGSGQKKTEVQQSIASNPVPAALWRVPEDIGRRYGLVSGDVNPIHLHRFSAKLFGFPRAIAHGMWTKARSLAALSHELPAAYRVEVQFKLPVFLPAEVAFSYQATDEGLSFLLNDSRSSKPHLAGTITRL